MAEPRAEPSRGGAVSMGLLLAACLRPYWRRCLLTLLAILVEVSFNTLFALSFTLTIDQALAPGRGGLLVAVLAGLTVAFVAAACASAARIYLATEIGTAVAADLRIKMFEHLQRLPA